MNIFEDLIEEIDRGILGQNRGLTTGKKKLDQSIGGIQRATYYAIGGETGTGKTAIADDCFVLNPYADFQRQLHNPNLSLPIIKFRVFYYSFEISKIKKIAKWVCHLMYDRYNIIIDIKEIYSRTSILSKEKYDLIKKCREYIDEMMDYVHIFDHPINPTGIYMEVQKYMRDNGKFIETIKIIKGQELKFKKYIPNDPDEIVLIIEDHIGLARSEKDLVSKKEIIDKGSEYAIQLRNQFGVSKLAISQFNRDLSDMDRRRFTELTPQISDFKNTGNVGEDAEIIMTVFNPARYNIQEYGGFSNLGVFGGRYRNLALLKSRDGQDMLKLNLNFMGEAGHFREFPDPFNQTHYNQAKNYIKFT